MDLFSTFRINNVPIYLGPLTLVGLAGSLLQNQQNEGFNISSALEGVVWNILGALVVSFIIIFIILRSDSNYKHTSKQFIIIFTWVYFFLGLISILRFVN